MQHWKGGLADEGEAFSIKFDWQAALVNDLFQARPDAAMQGNRARDDAFGQ